MTEDSKNSEPTRVADPTQEEKATPKQRNSQKLKKVQEDLAMANDKYIRLYAEFENFRRRAAKEKLVLMETASEALLRKLLPVVDDFERALMALQPADESEKATQEGIRLIYDKLLHLLHQEGVQQMPLAKGAVFDAEFCEAVTQMPTKDKKMQGKVLDVLEKGYLLKEKVLRFAKVVTGA
jgi:molecular chaperone GrpE